GDGVVAQPAGLGHRPSAPVRGVLGSRLQGLDEDLFDLFVGDLARRSRALLVQESRQPQRNVARAPLSYRLICNPKLTGNCRIGDLVGAAQDDAGALGESVSSLRALAPTEQGLPVLVGERQRCLGAAAEHGVNLIVGDRSNSTIISWTSLAFSD